MMKKMLLSIALMGATVAFATEGVSEMAVQLFGKEEAKATVEKGAVFIDGLFIKAPYKVSREGNVILVNGQIASRFKVESKMAEKNAADAAAAAQDEGSDGSDAVSEEDGASIGDEPAPTKKASTIEKKLAKKGGGSIESRLSEKKRKAELAKKSSAGSFNSEATSSDPEALFEEADYTYTPPKRPDPDPVPYIRPGMKKSASEQFAAAKAREAAAAAPAADAEEEIATENFDDLSEDEIKEFTEQFAKRREVIEKHLGNDALVLLSSNTSAAKVLKPSEAKAFVVSLPGLCKGSSSAKLVKQWQKKVPAAYLKRIFHNRDANLGAMKEITTRMKAKK